ncbi:hypothetical protein [Flavobacterium sp.]|uniref:hypothetical protein n=1 Tax=Flavobacterium sp. TaxID=239 RepID=UPI0039E3EB5C
MTSEASGKPTPTLQKVCILLGGICFTLPCIFVSFHLHFYEASAAVYHEQVHTAFLTAWELWGLNAALGIVGGALMDYRHPWVSAFSGLVTALAMTGFAFLYLFWRDSIYNYEIVLMIILGSIPGIVLNAFLRDKYVYHR